MKNNNHMAERLNVHYPLSINCRVAYSRCKVVATKEEREKRKTEAIYYYYFFFFLEGEFKMTSGVV